MSQHLLTPAHFATCFVPGFSFPAHVQAFQRISLDLITSQRKRVIVEVACRHGKSFWWSFIYPAWRAVALPGTSSLICGHSASLAEEFLSQARTLFQDYGPALGLSLKRETQDLLVLSNGSRIRAAGAGTGVAGRGFHYIAIDDAYRDQSEADSPTVRASIERWFWAEVMSRREPDAATAVILSRRHPDDLSGSLIKMNEDIAEAEQWQRIRFPAISDNGTALWPERFSLERLNAIRADYAAQGLPHHFESLFMQNALASPTTAEWSDPRLFESIFYDDLPPASHQISICALDASKGAKSKTGDDTAMVFARYGTDNTLYVEDVYAQPHHWEDACDLFALFVARHKPSYAVVETQSFQEALAVLIRQKLDALGCRVPLLPFDAGTERKEVRIRGQLGPLLAQHRLKFRNGAGVRKAVAQLRTWPSARHDDICDVLAIATTTINELLFGA